MKTRMKKFAGVITAVMLFLLAFASLGSAAVSIQSTSSAQFISEIEYTFLSGKVGTYYNDFIKAIGGSSPYTWTKTSGTIPNGLSMYRSGNYLYLRGTPTKAGTYYFTLKVTDAYGDTATKSFTLIISSALKIEYTFTGGKVGTYYNDYVRATGGSSPYTWTKTSGTIPPGLSISSSGGYLYLRGTPTRAGTYSFTIRVKDAYGNTATKTFTITITSNPVSITYTFGSGKVGTYYNDYVKVTGGTSPYTWTKTSGTIPNGLSMYRSGSNLYLRGTPTKAGTYYFTLKVKDTYGSTATKSFSMTIAPNPVSITYSFLNGKVGTYYNDYVKATGGTSPYTWTKTSGTIPNGLSMYRSGDYLYLRGTPTKAGTYSFTLKVTDKYGSTATKSFSMTISPALKIEYTFGSGKVGTYYNDYVKATGGSSPFTWTKTSGTIPSGLSLSSSGAYLYLKGTPTRAGTYSFTIKVKDAQGYTATKSFTMTIAPNPVTITYSFTSGKVGTYYNDYVKATGGTSPYTWTKTNGTIPSGLSMYRSGNYLYLRGTPTKAGTYSFTLKVKDKYGSTDTKSFTMTISSALKIEYTFGSGKVGTYYNDYVKVTGGSSPYTWTKTSGTIPNGLSMYRSGSNLYLRGTPTRAGTYSFTLKVKDAQGYTATKSFTMTISSALKIEYTFTGGRVDTYYNDFVKATGGSTPYTWTKTSGTIPPGLSMYRSGVYLYLKGTPTSEGIYSFTLKVKDAYGYTATKSFTMTIGSYSSYATSDTGSASPSQDTAQDTAADTGQADSVGATPQNPSSPTDQTGLTGTGDTAVNLSADLEVVSDDILESYDDRDSDLVKVRENMPVSFTISNFGGNVSGITVYVDDKPVNITISDEGLFTLPAEMVSGDFKVSAKAQSEAGELETNELYITAE